MLSRFDLSERAEGSGNGECSATPPTPPCKGGERTGGVDARETPATPPSPPCKGGERTEEPVNPGETVVTCNSPPFQGGVGGVAQQRPKPEPLDHNSLTALAQAQAALVRSLTVAAPAPDGFDPQLISLSARALIKKRVRTVARV